MTSKMAIDASNAAKAEKKEADAAEKEKYTIRFLSDIMGGEVLYWGSYLILGVIICITNFVGLPVLFQMVLYTLPVLYIGSHLSLLQKEIDPETGKHRMEMDAMTHHDAILFPFIGSATLLSLYLAYKFLSIYWVNLLLTLYLSIFGCAALAETLVNIIEKLTACLWRDTAFFYSWNPPNFFKKWFKMDELKISLSRCRIISYVASFAVVLSWLTTKHWALHNIFAIGFCLQGIRMVSVGNFKVALGLLIGLFVYDIFWVFGTDVMVTVAKSFEAPAKLIFPLSHNPWKQSILGLGDVVLPGVFIAMILRFDHHLSFKQDLVFVQDKTMKMNIHQEFSRFYFWTNMLAYEMGLVTTGVVMLVFKHAQPALLYLVPFCLVGLFVPAWWKGDLTRVLEYTEQPPTPEQIVEQEIRDKKTK